MTHIVPESTNK